MSQAQRDKTHDFTQTWDLKIGDLIKTESSKNRGEQGESGQSAWVARGRSLPGSTVQQNDGGYRVQ